MRNAWALFVLLLAMGLAVAAAGPAPGKPVVRDPARILFIGNSLTEWTDIPKRLASVAQATGRSLTVESIAYPDYSLADHLAEGTATRAIAKGWDVVVLQQGPSSQPASRTELVESVRRFSEAIRASGAKPAVYMVWPLASRKRDFPAVIASYRAAAVASDAILIPAGEAWLRAFTEEPKLALYSDSIHPSSLGGDLAVLTMYFSLFPAGPQEFDEAFVAKIARALDLPAARRDLFFDAATRAIDLPLAIQ